MELDGGPAGGASKIYLW